MFQLQFLNSLLAYFPNLSKLLQLLQSGNLSEIFSYNTIFVIAPFIRIVIFIEIIRALFFRQFKAADYKIPFFTYLFNFCIGRIFSYTLVGICITIFEKKALFQTTFTWYWFIYAYVIWEFSHYVFHFLSHKVRILWCLHATHHSPETMNFAINFTHFFLELSFCDVVRTTICILAGVSPSMFILIMFIDGLWATYLHVGEDMLKNGRLGILSKLILTPSHHRVHHAKNSIYLDKNFCNLLNIWDKLFNTYQPECKEHPIIYGVTRTVKSNNFLEAYFGEFVSLAKDVKSAPDFKSKLLYFFMPPGWSHNGDHKWISTNDANMPVNNQMVHQS